MLRIEVPHPPSVNSYYRHVGCRTLISREGRAYRETVCSLLRDRFREPLLTPLFVSVTLYPPDRRRRDVDNRLKGLLDALQHAGVYGDDSQIQKLFVEKREPVPGGKAIVEIEELHGAA